MGLGGRVIDGGASHYEWFDLNDNTLEEIPSSETSHQLYDVVLVSNTDFNKKKYPYYPSLPLIPAIKDIVNDGVAEITRFVRVKEPRTETPQNKTKLTQPAREKVSQTKIERNKSAAGAPKIKTNGTVKPIASKTTPAIPTPISSRTAKNRTRNIAKRNRKKAKIKAVSIEEHFQLKQLDGLHQVWNQPEANKILLIDIDNTRQMERRLANM